MTRKLTLTDSFLERHLPRLRAFIRLNCHKVVRDRESCTDLVQSVCRELLEREKRGHPDFANEDALCGWLFQKALDKVQDRARYWKAQRRDPAREVQPPPSSDERHYGKYYGTILTPSQVAMGREQLEQFEAACEDLPQRAREVITLSKVAGLTHDEIALQLGITKKDVANHLHRGLRRLSWILSDKP